jgi:hypothetical protein
MIQFIIYIFIQIRKFIIKDKEKNDPNKSKNTADNTEETEKESYKNKVRLAIYFPPIKNKEINKITSILVNSMAKQRIFDIYLLLNSEFKSEYKINNTVHISYINLHSSLLNLFNNIISFFFFPFFKIKK